MDNSYNEYGNIKKIPYASLLKSDHKKYARFAQIPQKFLGALILDEDLSKLEQKFLLLFARNTFGCGVKAFYIKSSELSACGLTPSHYKRTILSLFRKGWFNIKYYKENSIFLLNTSKVEEIINSSIDTKADKKLGVLVGRHSNKTSHASHSVGEAYNFERDPLNIVNDLNDLLEEPDFVDYNSDNLNGYILESYSPLHPYSIF